jgi:hypothetical protein
VVVVVVGVLAPYGWEMLAGKKRRVAAAMTVSFCCRLLADRLARGQA